MNLLKVLKDITTTADGQTFDNIRISSLLATLAYIAMSVANVFVLKHDFDPTAYGTGAAALFAAAGAAIRLKQTDEPSAQ